SAPTAKPQEAPAKGPAPARSRDQDANLERASTAARELHDALTLWMTEQGVDPTLMPEDELLERVRQGLEECLPKVTVELPKGVTQEALSELVEREVVGLGALEALVADESVEEVFVNGPRYVAVTRSGQQSLTDLYFSGEESLTDIVNRLLSRAGIMPSPEIPVVDARLKDGSKLLAVMSPVSPKGPVVTWRRARTQAQSVDELAANGTISQPMVEFLETCMQARRNVLIVGPADAGKTTLLGAVASLIDDSERVFTVEEAAELVLPQPQVVSLETRPPRPDGAGGVDLAALVRSALRMHPGRLVVGEVRGGEALPLLQAMSAGQDGTLLSVHAHSPRDCLARLEMMVLMGGQDLPVKAVRELIANAVDVIIMVTRFSDGSRRVTQVCEVSGMEVDIITMQDIFTYRREGAEDNGAGKGRFLATGFVPRFYEDLQQRGMSPNMGIFREDG
ncbi:MAG: ATPase, T2SS/T4P/T4SS family, partial [Myxococcota bacterium]